MAIIKQIKVFNGSTWNIGDIGANASNVSLSTSAISSSITNVESGINYLNNSKVSKSGDTMSGNLIISKASPVQLVLNTTEGGSNSFLRACANSNQSNLGNNVLLQSGGALILGSGESANAIYDNNVDDSALNTEQMFIAADSQINFYSNCGDLANKNTMTFNASGHLKVPGNVTLEKGEPGTLIQLYRTDVDPKIGQTIPTSSQGNQFLGGFHILGKDGNRSFYSESYKTTGDQVYQSFVCQRPDASNNTIRNGIYLRINADGSKSVTIQDQPWRSALNVYSKSDFPKSHASSTTDYGIGTGSNYGHTKVINNLTTSTSANGQALNAYQGYLLSTKINALNHGNSYANFDTKSVATATNTNLGSLKLGAAGYYLLVASLNFANNATGRRIAVLSTTSASLDALTRAFNLYIPPVSGAATRANIVGFYENSVANETIYLNVYQNSGSALSISGGLYAYKLGI